MDWESVIGLEIHIQLKTQSKIFSSSPTGFGAKSNTQASYIDVGLPGVLPSLNALAVIHAIGFGLAINAAISRQTFFARKNYFYPDLPKGYQISQHKNPIVENGLISIRCKNDRGEHYNKEIEIERAHLEEDAGKSIHEHLNGYTGIDLNRAGIPLLEVVSRPVLYSPEEAVGYARAIHQLVQWIDLCDGNLQNGSFRIDANVSVRPKGEKDLRTRCEIKNLNSFRFLEKAIDYEINRQISAYKKNQPIHQETRLYDAEKNQTRSMRQKESAHDYRYFCDPDLPPLRICEKEIEEIRRRMPIMPWDLQKRLMEKHAINAEEAQFVTQTKEHATYFENMMNTTAIPARSCIHWMGGILQNYLNEHEKNIAESEITPQNLALIIKKVEEKTLSQHSAKELFKKITTEKEDIEELIKKYNLSQIDNQYLIYEEAKKVIDKNRTIVAQVKQGKEKAINALIGPLMKSFSGKINALEAKEALIKIIEEEG